MDAHWRWPVMHWICLEERRRVEAMRVKKRVVVFVVELFEMEGWGPEERCLPMNST